MNDKLARINPLEITTWPENAMFFGIAIQVTHRPSQQFHTAALYRFREELWIGDLQSHLRTCRTKAKPTKDIFWIAPELTEEDQRILAAKIDAWLDNNENKIPYSVAHPGGVIFHNDIWIGSAPGQGLTCATFIIELFKELAIPFINIQTWKNRNGDEEWAQKILNWIGSSMSQEHVTAQLKRIGETVRIRPTDVAAAGLLVTEAMEEALTFDEISPTSQQIETKLLSCERFK